ncbi:hypothetical protein PG989_007400 [Apiospora arundinis]
MVKILDLSDELLLTLIEWLPFESYFCLVRTCHTFRRISYDPACQRKFDSSYSPTFFSEDHLYRYTFLIERTEYPYEPNPTKDVTTHMDLFNPPTEYMPPWPPTGIMRATWRPHPNWLQGSDPVEYSMGLHKLFWNIHTWENRHISNVAGLLLKDSLCTDCWTLRGTSTFGNRLKALLRPVYCSRCNIYHPRAMFPSLDEMQKDSGPACTGWTAQLQVCAHMSFQWKDYQHVSGKYSCKECNTTLDATRQGSNSIRREIDLPLSDIWFHKLEHSSLDGLRSSLSSRQDGICPHLKINDPSLITYLLHALKHYYIMPNVEVPLVDFRGQRWGCPVCKASFSVLYSRSALSRLAFKSQMKLVTTRVINFPPCHTDSKWLAQLEPLAASRGSFNRGITWCDNASCGTSRGRRKEALLVRMLDRASISMRMEYGGLSLKVDPQGRADWLWYTLWWFWRNAMTPAEDKSSHIWTQLDQKRREVYNELIDPMIQQLFNRSGNPQKRKSRIPAIDLAIFLGDGNTGIEEGKAMVQSGVIDLYETYLMRKRRRTPAAIQFDLR